LSACGTGDESDLALNSSGHDFSPAFSTAR